MAELLLKLRPLIRSAAEVPLVLRYDLKRGKSKMKVLRTIFRYIKLLAHRWRKNPHGS
jgi:dolichol-phosphate mannosyltransferase